MNHEIGDTASVEDSGGPMKKEWLEQMVPKIFRDMKLSGPKFTASERLVIESWSVDQPGTPYFGKTDEGDEWFVLSDRHGVPILIINKDSKLVAPKE